MAYAPTVQAEAGFTANSLRHYGEALTAQRTASLSHADVYSGLQAVIAILAALHRRAEPGAGDSIAVALAATLRPVKERPPIDLGEIELSAELAVLRHTESNARAWRRDRVV